MHSRHVLIDALAFCIGLAFQETVAGGPVKKSISSLTGASTDNTVHIDVDLLTRLGQFVLVYGVYAVLILFLIVLERRAYGNVERAKTPRERVFFQRKYSQVLASVIILGVVATATWIYGTFFYHQVATIEGSVTGVRQGGSHPAAAGSNSILLRVTSYPADVKLYRSEEKISELRPGESDILWVLVTPKDEQQVLLRFEHSCEFLPVGARSRDDLQTATPQYMDLPLDLKSTRLLSLKMVGLRYSLNQNDPCRLPGALWLFENGRFTPLPWERDAAPPKTRPDRGGSSIFSVNEAWAGMQTPKRSVPRLADDVTRGLPEKLASEDLGTQLAAREVLIGNGALSFSLIERNLQVDKRWTQPERRRLVQSLATVSETIERAGFALPVSLQLSLASALYEIRDYRRCRSRFAKIPEGAFASAPRMLLLRGAVDSEVQDYGAALASFEAYLARATNSQEKSIAYGNIGAVRLHQYDNQRAREAVREALRLDPFNDGARENLGILELRDGHYEAAGRIFSELLRKYPTQISLKDNMAGVYDKTHQVDKAIGLLEDAVASAPDDVIVLNDLAALYAEKGVHLDVAARYADQVLQSVPDEPLYIDTKAWVEFRRGRVQEALSLLEKAERIQKERKLPANEDIENHLVEVRRVRAQAKPPS